MLGHAKGHRSFESHNLIARAAAHIGSEIGTPDNYADDLPRPTVPTAPGVSAEAIDHTELGMIDMIATCSLGFRVLKGIPAAGTTARRVGGSGVTLS